MATLVTRSGKGSPLTHAEVDANFTNLNTDKLELSGGTMTGNLSFGDNDKAIFGAGSDLQIYHDGSHSYVSDQGTGNLYIQAQDLVLEKPDGTNYLIGVGSTGSVYVYNNGSLVLNTSSTGIEVTGNVSADGLTVDGDAKFTDISPAIILSESDTTNVNTRLGNYGGDFSITTVNDSDVYVANRLTVDHATGDISFYEDTGTTAKFFWDASAESLGIGETSPSSYGKLTLLDGATRFWITESTANEMMLSVGASERMLFGINNSEAMRINSSGNVGIGVTDPVGRLEVKNSGDDNGFEFLPAYSSNINLMNSYNRNTNTYYPLENRASYFMFKNGTSEAMRIDSSGNVGIGTSSPSSLLEVSDVAGNPAISITADAAGVSDLNLGDENDLDVGRIRYAHAINSMLFNTNATERMRIDSSGNVGIGTSSPAQKLHVSGGQLQVTNGGTDVYLNSSATNSYVYTTSTPFDIYTAGSPRVRVGSTGNVGIGTTSPNCKLHISGGSGARSDVQVTYDALGTGSSDGAQFGIQSGGAYLWNFENSALYFATNNTERMRIDSSGNLLVGKTSGALGTAGSAFYNYGLVESVRDGNKVMTLNRLTSDGDIIDFRKDGSTVGSIGVYSGDITVGNGNAGLIFNDAVGLISPWDMTANAVEDNAIDLGYSAGRFKDLYLSGGVYLGGTGAANKLDDYEEGTWTPTAIGDTGSATLSDASGKYVKIGSLVHITCEVDVSNVNTATGNVYIGGLPFTVANILSPTSIEASVAVGYWTGFSTAINSLSAAATAGQTYCALYGLTSSTATGKTTITWSDFGAGEIRLTLTYRA